MTDLQNALEQLHRGVACLLPREAKALLEEREALRVALEEFILERDEDAQDIAFDAGMSHCDKIECACTLCRLARAALDRH